MTYRLEIEDSRGVFRFVANYKTAHVAWLRGWEEKKESDFRVLNPQGRRINFSDDGVDMSSEREQPEIYVLREYHDAKLASKDKRVAELTQKVGELVGNCVKKDKELFNEREHYATLKEAYEEKDKRIKEISDALLIQHRYLLKAKKAWKEVEKRGYQGGSVWCEAMDAALGVD